jgi:hypothetical protein
VFLAGKTPEEIDAMRDRLQGAIVMTQPILTNFVRKDRPQPSDPNYAPRSATYATAGGGGRGGATDAQHIAQTLRDSGAGVILKPSLGEHGTVFVTGRDGGPGAVPTVTLAAEHYNMIARMLERHVAVMLRVHVQSKFYDADNGNAYNVIGELAGADPALRDEVVMLGAHLDSWHTGVGATDHLSFIGAGVPGFNPIQNYENYDVRTHHTNMDTPERLSQQDIRQAAIVMASFAYRAAVADQKIPRAAPRP